jgi:hypothetical protein
MISATTGRADKRLARSSTAMAATGTGALASLAAHGSCDRHRRFLQTRHVDTRRRFLLRQDRRRRIHACPSAWPLMSIFVWHCFPINFSRSHFVPHPLRKPRNALPNWTLWMRRPIADEVVGSCIFSVAHCKNSVCHINESDRNVVITQFPAADQRMIDSKSTTTDPTAPPQPRICFRSHEAPVKGEC